MLHAENAIVDKVILIVRPLTNVLLLAKNLIQVTSVVNVIKKLEHVIHVTAH